MDAKIRIKNYKLHEDLEVEFKSGNMYFVLGPNGTGKTSFSQAIFDLAEGTSSNKQKLTNNKQNGFVAGTFHLDGADGETYQVLMEYKQGAADKFLLTLPDGSTSKRKSDIVDIFKYNKFTVDEFFAWGLTADGRRKQAEMFMKMLSADDQKLIVDIDAAINQSTGVTFLKRRDVNRDIDRVKGVINTFTLSEMEHEIGVAGKNWAEEQEKLKEELATKKIAKGSQEATEISNKALKDAFNNAVTAKNDYEIDVKLSEKRFESDINTLKEQLAEKIKEHNLYKNRSETILNEKKDAIDRYQKEYNAKHVEIEEINLESLETKIQDNAEAIEQYNAIVQKTDVHNKNLEELKELQTTYDDLNDQLDTKRRLKKDIIQEGINIDGISFEDGELMYIDEKGVLLPFNEQNISYSAGGIIVFELMAAINQKLPIWVIGKASEYDDEKIQYLIKRAKELNGVIIGDFVDRTAEEFKIEIVDETKFTNTK